MHEVESYLKLHPAFFREIFQERTVNNIYFDTCDFKNFMDNVNGNSERKKVRIRWYGELFGKIEKPVLEYKIKSSIVGKKESYPIKGFSLDATFDYATVVDVIKQSNVPEIVKEDFQYVEPALLNNYKRKYFLSSDKNYRVTIDRDLAYYNIKKNNNLFLSKFQKHQTIIVELKYNSQLDNQANSISTLFPFRLTKSSKYVNGVDIYYGTYL